jgi:hypothetical protein
MIAVAVKATIVAGGAASSRHWWKRRVYYLNQANIHAQLEQRFAATILYGEPPPRSTVRLDDTDHMAALVKKYGRLLLAEERSQKRDSPAILFRPDLINRAWMLARDEVAQAGEVLARRRHEEKRLADYHAKLRKKYERAARYPWLPVEPDPPEPQISSPP